MFEKRCGATPCIKTAYNKKRPFSKQNRPNFMSLRGAQRRGNLKAEGMASRSEARERKTTESPNSDPSRRDTTTALARKRHFTRAQAHISHASVSFTRSKIVFHCAALAVPRSGMPSRSVKDCRVGRTRPPRNDITEGFVGKWNGFRNEKFEIIAERYHAKNNREKITAKMKNVRFPNKTVPISCHCEAAARPWQS